MTDHDGVTSTAFGSELTLNDARQVFLGHRFAMFHYAIQALGGAGSGTALRPHDPLGRTQ
jgi:hypothetical protein